MILKAERINASTKGSCYFVLKPRKDCVIAQGRSAQSLVPRFLEVCPECPALGQYRIQIFPLIRKQPRTFARSWSI